MSARNRFPLLLLPSIGTCQFGVVGAPNLSLGLLMVFENVLNDSTKWFEEQCWTYAQEVRERLHARCMESPVC